LDELEKLTYRRDWMETAAAHLIPGRPPPGKPAHRSPTEWLAAPIPCNDSQEHTLERLRREPLTVVTGPPGTGKTQLVVNAVANAWLDRETVLVASTNNGAVDVAVKRSNEICLGMLLRTGRRRDREALADRAAEAVAAATDRTESADGLKGVAHEAQARAKLAQTAERWARLVADLASTAELQSKLAKTLGDLENQARAIWKQNRAPESILNSERIERRVRRLERAWLFRRLRTRRLLRSIGCGSPNVALGVLARWAAIDQARIVLMNDLSATEDRIGDADASLRQAAEQWSEASKAAVFDRTNPGGSTVPKRRRSCRRHARGWACTALSMQRNFPLEPRLFDLALVDEASQCSLSVALPLAYRTKRLAVIGDPSQLTPIVALPDGRLRAISASERL
ncbi:MAG: AAA domain-containing protein, partial [Alphaproteobacteria bacterium]|nr:AAA domain-containing protein [Alphaproteobacteria bacterium]